MSILKQLLFIVFSSLSVVLTAGNTPCTATVLANDMTDFLIFNNNSNTDSGIQDPGCGNYITKDIWFEVQAHPNGKLYIATTAGSLINGAMAIYEGPCINPTLISCVEHDLCGNTDMPITSFDDLTPNGIYYIRVWAENGAPNGTFGIRVTEEDIIPIPFDLTNSATYIDAECIQLTTSSPGQKGCAWYPELTDFSLPFSHSFSLNFGSQDANGADGICLVYQSNDNTQCGNTGGEIGAGSIPNSLIIEFDTWFNGDPAHNDPNFDHCAVNTNGSMNHNTAITPAVILNGGNVENNQYFDVTFNWDPSVDLFEIIFDGALLLNGSYDVINNCFGGSNLAYWGFTASTGGSSNNQIVCPGFPTYPHGSESIDTVFICEGETYPAGGGNQSASGIYSDFYNAANGCDSIIHTDLNVLPTVMYDLPQEVICDGECITVAGQQFCDNGVFQTTTQAVNGCDSIINIDLVVLKPIAVAFPPALPLSCNIIAVQIDGSSATTGTGIIYTWTGPNGFTSTDQSPWVTQAGIYSFTLVQEFGGTTCFSNTFDVEVLADLEVPTADAGEDINLSCDGNIIVLDGSGSTNGNSITYSWTGPNGFSSIEQSPQITESGDYILIVLDLDNGCFSFDEVTVTGDIQLPVVTANGGTIDCSMDSLQLFGISDLDSVTYSWQGPNGFESSDQNPFVIDSGEYSLIVSTNGGCASGDTALVIANTILPDVSAIGDTLSCLNPNGQLMGFSNSQNPSFYWTGPNGFESTEQNPNASIAGDYILFVTGSNGCTDSTIVALISDADVPQIQLQADTLNCNNTELNLDLVSTGDGLIFSWVGPNGFTSSDTMPLINEEGIYILTVNSSNGCEVTDSILISSDTALPQISLTADTISCTSGSAQITSSSIDSTLVFTWNGPNSFQSSDQNPIVSASGIYTLNYIALNGCSDSLSIEIYNDTDVPDLSVSFDTIDCLTLDAQLSASSSDTTVTFEWIGPNGYTSDLSNPIATEAGSYDITIYADNGCIASQNINIIVDTLAPLVEYSDGDIDCIQTSILLTNSQNSTSYSYAWSGPNGFSSNEEEPIALDEGEYAVTVSSPNGCESYALVEITVDTMPPSLEVGLIDSLNCQSPQGEIEASSNDLIEIFSWNGPNGFTSSSSNPSITDPGIYEVTVTASNGCFSIDQVNVPADTLAPIFSVIDDALDCNQIEVNLVFNSVGTGETVLWEGPNGFNSSDTSPLISQDGIYSLTLTNADGCSTTHELEIAIDTISPIFNLDGANISCNANSTEIQVTSGDSSWEYDWSGPSNYTSILMDIIVSELGQYNLITTDPNNGCTYENSIFIDQITGPTDASLDVQQPDCFGNTFGIIEIESINGGTAPFMYALDQNTNYGDASIFDNLEPGDYTVFIIDANDCTFETTVSIYAYEDLSLTIPAQLDLSFGEDAQIIAQTNIDPSNVQNITWSPSENLSCSDCLDPIITATTSGTFTIIITDNNGCEIEASIYIRVEASKVYFPNIFSPNNDGINDFFAPNGNTEQIESISEFYVFDRWGNRVYAINDLNVGDTSSGWDGNIQGKSAVQGVYAYMARIQFKDGSEELFGGDITLAR